MPPKIRLVFAALFLGATTLLTLNACTYGKVIQVDHDPRIESDLREYITEHEELTGLPFLGEFEVRVIRAYRIDREGVSIAISPRGYWSAAWVSYPKPGEPFVITIAEVKGKTIPGKVLRHEALHLVLLSNGVVGHPEEYADLAWRWHDHGREPKPGEEDYTEEEYANALGRRESESQE